MATGSYFGDMNSPKVVIKAGEKGDVGSMEIIEMIFSTKGPTAGAIMVEWNVLADKPGSGRKFPEKNRIAELTTVVQRECRTPTFE